MKILSPRTILVFVVCVEGFDSQPLRNANCLPGQVASFPPEIPFSSVLLLYSAFLAFSALALP